MSRRRFRLGHLLDIAAASGFAGIVLWLFHAAGAESWLLWFVQPMLAGAWSVLRMGGTLRDLADRGRRESLAVTPIAPGSYLAPRLRVDFAFSLTPAALSHIAMAFSLISILLREWPNRRLAAVLWAFMLASRLLGDAAITITASLEGLRRLCIPPPPMFPLAVSIARLCGTLLWVEMMTLLGLVCAGNDTPLLIIAGLGIAAIVASVMLMRLEDAWRELKQTYLMLDARPS